MVLVDGHVDQGGCFETSRPTTHAEPTYVVDGVVHYCVANMPGAVGRTSTQALCHATQPYVIRLAQALGGDGLEALVRADAAFTSALNMHKGKVTHEEVAERIHGYLSTLGRDKVGFSITGHERNGDPYRRKRRRGYRFRRYPRSSCRRTAFPDGCADRPRRG